MAHKITTGMKNIGPGKAEVDACNAVPGYNSLDQLNNLVGRYPVIREIDNGDLYRKLSLAALDPHLASGQAIKKLGEIIGNNDWVLDARFLSSLRLMTGKVISRFPGRLYQISNLLDCQPWEEHGDPVLLRQLVSILGDDTHVYATIRKNFIESLEPRDFLSQTIRSGSTRRNMKKVLNEMIKGHPWMAEPRCLAPAVFVAQAVNCAEQRYHDPVIAAERLLALIESRFDVRDIDDHEAIEHIAMITCNHVMHYDSSIRKYGEPEDIIAEIEKFLAACGNDAGMREPGMLDRILHSAAVTSSNCLNKKFVLQLFDIKGVISRGLPPHPDCGMDWLARLLLGLVDAAGQAHFTAHNPFSRFIEMADQLFRSENPGIDCRRICEIAARYGTELLRGRVDSSGLFRAVTALTWRREARGKDASDDIEKFLSLARDYGFIIRDIELDRNTPVMGGYFHGNPGLYITDFIYLLAEINPEISVPGMKQYLDVYVECLEHSFNLDKKLKCDKFFCTLVCRLIVSSPGYAMPGNIRALADACKNLMERLAGPDMRLGSNVLAYRNFYLPPAKNTPYKDAISVVKKYRRDGSILGALAFAGPGLLDPENHEKLARYMKICVSAQEETDREYGCGYLIVKGLEWLLKSNPGVLAENAEQHLMDYIGLFSKFAKMTIARGLGMWAQDRFPLVTDILKNHPETADPVNFANLKEIVLAYMEFILHRYDPVYLHEYIIKPLFEKEPGLLLANGLDRLKASLRLVRRFLDRGMVPIDIDADDGRVIALQGRRDELACGAVADPASSVDVNLFYSILPGDVWWIDSYEDFRKTTGEASKYRLQAIPLPIESAVITAGGVRPMEKDMAAVEKALHFRDYLASIYENPLLLAGEAGLLAQLNKPGREAIINKLAAPEGALEEIVSRLMFRQLKNYQPRIASFIEKLIFIIAMRESAELSSRIKGTDTRKALFAVKELLGHRTGETMENILPEEYYTRLAQKIELETGCRILKEEFAGAGLRDKIKMLSKEIGTYGHVLGLKKKLNDAAAVTPDTLNGNGLPVPIDVNTIARGETLLLEEELRLNTEEIYLAATGDGGAIKRTLEVNNYNLQFLISSNRHLDLIVKDGIFIHDTRPDDTGDPLVNGLKAIQFPDPVLEIRLRRNYHVIKNRILPLLQPISKESMAVLEAAGRALSGRHPMSSGKDEFIFIPAKDWTLAFRHAVSHDCSRELKNHLLHPYSFFFKIIHKDRWCGYLLLLDVGCKSGGRALVIDVINVETSESVDWAGVMRNFVEYLSAAAVKQCFRYILMTSIQKFISNSEFISRSIHAGFTHCRVIPREEFTLDPPDDSFQSMKNDFRVMWEAGVQLQENLNG